MRQLSTALAGIARDAHFVLNPVTGLYERATLLEGSRTNLAYRSEADVGWTAGGTTPPTVDSQNTVVDGITCTQTTFPAISGSNYSTCRVVGTSNGAIFVIGTQYIWRKWLRLSRALTADEAIAVYVTGSWAMTSAMLTAASSQAYVDTWAELTAAPSVAGVAGSGYFVVYAVKLLSPLTVYSSRRQIEAGPFSTSYIPNPNAAIATRAADSLSFPFPYAPQAMTLYAKFIERGTAQLASSAAAVLGFGNGSGDRFGIWGSTAFAGSYRCELLRTVGTSSSSHVNNPVSIGDLVELLTVINADGSAQLSLARNGGALVNGGAGAVPTAGLPAAWNQAVMHVGGRSDSTTGFAAFLAVKVARGIKTLDQMRALARAA